MPSQQTPSQSRLCVIIQRPILLSCSSSNPRVVTRQPSVSDALIHAKPPGRCCHALTCRFYFPPCLPAMLIRPENGHSYCCMHENDTLVTSAAISPAIDELAQAEGMCGFYLLTVPIRRVQVPAHQLPNTWLAGCVPTGIASSSRRREWALLTGVC